MPQILALVDLSGPLCPAPETPDEAILDRVPNAHADTQYAVRFSIPEFTVLCAVTGQPDFAHFVIDYVRNLADKVQVLEILPGIVP